MLVLILISVGAAAVVGLVSKLLKLQHVWPGIIMAFILTMLVGLLT